MMKILYLILGLILIGFCAGMYCLLKFIESLDMVGLFICLIVCIILIIIVTKNIIENHIRDRKHFDELFRRDVEAMKNDPKFFKEYPQIEAELIEKGYLP